MPGHRRPSVLLLIGQRGRSHTSAISSAERFSPAGRPWAMRRQSRASRRYFSHVTAQRRMRWGARTMWNDLLLELGGFCLEVRLTVVVPNCADFAQVL